jgi:Tfp pilus assembly pilus retraction ATPase PilT
VVTQTVIRQPIGPGVIAREVLLNTPTVAKLIAAGRTSQLAAAIEGGRSSGMVSLDQTLLDLVRASAVDIHEAYRRAGDRVAFLEVLQREGIDTSILEPPR